jgi:fibronectin-binding autotransporter adhesin
MFKKFEAFIIAMLSALGASTTLAGCGGGVGQPTPPPGGSFSNSSLNGTYIVSFFGYDDTNRNESFFAVLGTVTANGSGGFTGGTIDIDDPALGSALGTGYVFNRLAASGSYSISADGRGSGSLSATINGTQVRFGIDLVLTSGTHGLISRFDQSGSGSGSIDLQASNIDQSSLQGSYAFGLNGVDSTIDNSLSSVGAFTLDSNGNVTSGVQDFNDNGNSRGLRALTMQGSVNAGSPGMAQLTTNTAGFGALHFDVFAIDPTHLKLIETDSVAFLSGDALVSTGHTAFPSGPLVFNLGGEDTLAGSFAAAGQLTSDGSSQITGGLEDINDDGYVSQAPNIHGAFTSDGPRTTLTLNGIYNGYFVNNSLGTGNYTFAAYPYNGGVMLLETDNGASNTPGISGGNMYVQTATSIPQTQGYGLNLSGANGNGEVDLISEFSTNTTNNMAGLYDVNNFGWTMSGFSLGNGSYSIDSNGRGTASFPELQTSGNSMIGALNLAFYVVDDSTAIFVETDGNQLATGAFETQTPTATSAALKSHFALVRPKEALHTSLRLSR